MDPWAESTSRPQGGCMRYISASPAARRRALTARPSLRHVQIIQQLCNTPPPRQTWSPRLQLRLDRARSVRWPGLTVPLHADGWQVDAEVDKLEETLRAAVRPTPKSAHHRMALGPVQSHLFLHSVAHTVELQLFMLVAWLEHPAGNNRSVPQPAHVARGAGGQRRARRRDGGA
jgi:hypothetical protein